MPLVALAGCVVKESVNAPMVSVLPATEVVSSAFVVMLDVAVAPDVVAFVMPARI